MTASRDNEIYKLRLEYMMVFNALKDEDYGEFTPEQLQGRLDEIRNKLTTKYGVGAR